MVAHVSLSEYPQSVLRVDDPITLIALQNFCYDNLKIILEKTLSNKKASDLLKDTNDLMNFIGMVVVAMEKFQLRIIQEFYLNKNNEISAMLEKQILDGKFRLDELNRMYQEVVAKQLAEHRALEIAYLAKRTELLSQRDLIIDDLKQFDFKIQTLETKLSQIDNRIKTNVSAPTSTPFNP